MKHHIQENCGKLVSIRTIVRVFRREGLTLLRPRPAPAKGDPEKQQAFLEMLQERIQHAGPRDRYFFFDAASVQRSATVKRMWTEKGKQPEVKTCGGRERVHVLGVLDCTEGRGMFTTTERLNGEGLITFLRKLLEIYPGLALHVLLDNAPAHHAKVVTKFVKKQCGRLELLYLPPYSPRLNPIEKFWEYLRGEVTHNTYYDTFEAFQVEVFEFLRKFKELNQKIFDLCNMYYESNAILVAAV